MLISANFGCIQEKNEFVKLEMFRHNFNECLSQKPRKKWIFLRFFYAYIPSISEKLHIVA